MKHHTQFLTTLGCLILSILCFGSRLNAVAPDLMNYQGYLTNSSEVPLDGSHVLEIRIYGSSDGNDLVWGPEIFDGGVGIGYDQRVSVVNGYFNLILGPKDTQDRNLYSAFTSGENRFIEITVDTNPPIAPRQQILSAPYAFSVLNNSIGADQINDNTITSSDIKDGEVQSADLASRIDIVQDLNVVTFGDYEPMVSLIATNIGGKIVVKGGNGSTNALLQTSGANTGQFFLYNANSDPQVAAWSYNGGNVYIYNSDGQPRIQMGISQDGAGEIKMIDPNGNSNFVLSSNDAGYGTINANEGIIVNGTDGNPKVTLDAFVGGEVHVANSNSTNTIRINSGPYFDPSIRNKPIYSFIEEGGSIDVFDWDGGLKARMYVDNEGRGVVEADHLEASSVSAEVKAFVVEHPTRPGYKITYISLEGPEAGMYHRGKVQLEQGRAIITFPEHFAVLAIPESITVNLTPKSLESKGLGIVSITGEAVEIGELFGGMGSYEVHFIIYASRIGYEDHQPVTLKEEGE